MDAASLYAGIAMLMRGHSGGSPKRFGFGLSRATSARMNGYPT